MIIITAISKGLPRTCLERLLSCEVEAFVSLITSRPTFLQHSISKHGRLRKGQTTHLAELPRCLGEGVQKMEIMVGACILMLPSLTINWRATSGNFSPLWNILIKHLTSMQWQPRSAEISAYSCGAARVCIIIGPECNIDQPISCTTIIPLDIDGLWCWCYQLINVPIVQFNKDPTTYPRWMMAKDNGNSFGKPLANHSSIVNALRGSTLTLIKSWGALSFDICQSVSRQ